MFFSDTLPINICYAFYFRFLVLSFAKGHPTVLS